MHVTVAHFDKLGVMEMGSVVEEGAPPQLAANPDSHYAHLLAASKLAVDTAPQRQAQDT